MDLYGFPMNNLPFWSRSDSNSISSPPPVPTPVADESSVTVVTVMVKRWASTPDGVFGTLTVTKQRKVLFTCYTVERPWLKNERNVSCIPAGAYRAKIGVHYGEGQPYECVELLNVPGRDNIEIHVANTMDDLEGCIGIGRDLGFAKGRWAVTESRATLTKLLELLLAVDRFVVRVDWDLEGE